MEGQDAEHIRTRDGSDLLVRPITPDDREAFLRNFEHLSAQTRYRRFLAPIKQLTNDEVTYFTEVNHRDHEALIALTPGGEIVGIARYIRFGPDSPGAEVAVTVADGWQGRGVGTALLARLAERGLSEGVEAFQGICLAGNTDMQRLLRELGPGARKSHPEDGVVEIEARLPPIGDHHRVLGPALRAAAQGHHQARRPGADEH
jgi:RimJ/RimL family protein N-acetyltransferase